MPGSFVYQVFQWYLGYNLTEACGSGRTSGFYYCLSLKLVFVISQGIWKVFVISTVVGGVWLFLSQHNSCQGLIHTVLVGVAPGGVAVAAGLMKSTQIVMVSQASSVLGSEEKGQELLCCGGKELPSPSV